MRDRNGKVRRVEGHQLFRPGGHGDRVYAGHEWLLLTGTWLETAGGPLNLVVAFALCIIIELPFAFAYMEAIPMLPLPGGEVVYSYAAFGSRGASPAGWAGILMNTIVFCWVDLAAVSLLDELFPALGRTAVLMSWGISPSPCPTWPSNWPWRGPSCGCSSGAYVCTGQWPRWCC